MRLRRIAISAAVCLAATAVLGQEPECATNYHSDGKSAETLVMTSLTPKAVIERLPSRLAAAGASMEWTEPQKGTLKAAGLEVSAEASGSATRVTFRSSAAASKTALCRYASLVGNPPVSRPFVAQDPALIAQMKDDLIKKHMIVKIESGVALNNATITSLDDFLELAITAVKAASDGKREYDVSMLLPHDACNIAREALDDSSSGMAGFLPEKRTKPVRVDATLVYANEGGKWRFADASIVNIESTK